MRPTAAAIGSPMRVGTRRMTTPLACVGMPFDSRSTTCGGVRMAMRTRPRPPPPSPPALSAPGAALDQVDRDLGAGVARADHDHVAARERLGVAVVGGVHQLAAEAVGA